MSAQQLDTQSSLPTLPPTLPSTSPSHTRPPPVFKPSPKILSLDQPPSALKPRDKNPRRHSPKQIFKLKKSMACFGFTVPVVADEEGSILAGEARWQAAKEMKLALIPTRVILGLSSAEKRAYRIADNKIALLSSWDPDRLREEMELLIAEDFEIDLTGFSTVEIDLMLEPAETVVELQDEDLAPELVTRLGDLWTLGGHRLLCGDALAEASYWALLGSDKTQMAITDPPYNVPIQGHAGGLGKVKHQEFAMASGDMTRPEFVDFLGKTSSHLVKFTADGAISFIFMDWRHQRELLEAAEPAFGAPKQMCVWVKDNAGMGSFYRSGHELVFAFKKGTAPHINNFELGQHGRYRTNVWEYPSINSGRGRELLALHPTVKPMAMIVDAILDCSDRQGLILDPFAGSGTVLVAAERSGRRARAIELEPKYVDVGIRRWQRVTGQQAVLMGTGQTWSQVRDERHRDEPDQVLGQGLGKGLVPALAGNQAGQATAEVSHDL